MGGNSSSQSKPAGNSPVVNTPPKLSMVDKTILDIKRQQGRLIKCRIRLDEDAKKLYMNASKLKSVGDKDRALIFLRLRRSKVKESQNLEANIAKLEDLKTGVEIEARQVEVLQVLAAGTKVLERLHAEIPLELAETILEKSAAAVEQEKQMAALLSSEDFSAFDQAELEGEFAALTESGPAPTAATSKNGVSVEAPASSTTAAASLPAAPLPAVPTKQPMVAPPAAVESSVRKAVAL